jgi:hypothetical protein
MINQSLEDGYDSSLTSSGPDPSDPYSVPNESDLSSCINDEDEGKAQTPNVFSKYSPTKSSINQINDSLSVHSSWEIVEGSSIVMEVEDSFSTLRSKNKDEQIFIEPIPISQLLNEHDSKKSSESLTATFASASRQDGKITNKLEESKQNEIIKSDRIHHKEKPFEYAHFFTICCINLTIF